MKTILPNGGYEQIPDNVAQHEFPNYATGWRLEPPANVEFTVSSNTGCLQSLPTSCTSLSGTSNLELEAQAPTCFGDLVPLLGPDRAGTIEMCQPYFTAGNSESARVLDCLDAMVICRRGESYKALAGEKFVTVFGDPVDNPVNYYPPSLRQRLRNVPTASDTALRPLTLQYAYNYVSSGSPGHQQTCNIVVRGDNIVIEQFPLGYDTYGMWKSRSVTYTPRFALSWVIFQLDCSSNSEAYDDVLFDEISVSLKAS